MRLLHTSDWHIGRSLHGADLLADQERVLTGLADLIRAESVDVVLVAGDIYDRAIPPAAATAVLDSVLTTLRATGARLVITPGNHDSSIRLAYAAGLLAANGVHLRTSVPGLAEPVLIDDAHGTVGIYGIPYLEPDLAKNALGAPQARGHTDVLRAAMDQIRADRNRRGLSRTVVLAHAFVAGGARADSERDISVGGVEVVPADIFADVDYVALGHLHRAQEIAPGIRYSGSPLAYSFPEADQVKSVTLVDLDAEGLSGVAVHPLDRPRGLVTLTGTLDDLISDPRHEVHLVDYVSAQLLDTTRPVDAMRRLRARFSYCVHLDWAPTGEHKSAGSYGERIAGRHDLAIVTDFVQHVRATPVTTAETELLSAALAAGRVAEHAS
ncbi:MAG: exonuclease subunit SbcD [Geodermatophilaceae bacterium]|nr:exonuclease subunit SbcD [Geodermatophilaceae bacterium]